MSTALVQTRGNSAMQNFRPSNILAKAPAVQEYELNRRLRLEFEGETEGMFPIAPSQLVSLAQKLMHARCTRETFFSGDMYGEAGWEMLLALFCADAAGQRMTVSKLCEASRNPSTTALRWLDKLLERGFVSRKKNPLDARVIFIELQPTAQIAIRSYLVESWRTFYG